MSALLAMSRFIDNLSRTVGKSVAWLVVAAILISAGNALVRKLLDTSSNAWLELQWWLFGAVFLLAAPWTLAAGEHIRIDVLSSRLPAGVQRAILLLGHLLFLLPVAAVVLATSWPSFLVSFAQNEQSANAGGLPQWPAKLLIPVGFALLLLQGVSELIKAVASMRGGLPAEGAQAAGPHHPAEVTATLGPADRPPAER